MSDIQDLEGVFPTPFRWNAETGTAGYDRYDPDLGERTRVPIELGSRDAVFALDFATRARGYAKILVGTYDMRLTPVLSAPPPYPGDDDFKPAIGCWLWNPHLGELRLETNGAIFLRAVDALWTRCRSFEEASKGLQPVICFVGRREKLVKAVGKTFWEPVIDLRGWAERDKIPAFAARNATVAAPAAIDAQVPFMALPAAVPSGKRGKVKNPDGLKAYLDDSIDDVGR
jgi:hypothetical protein